MLLCKSKDEVYLRNLSCFSGSEDACEQKSFLFLRKELPVRLANIMKEINLLPETLLRMPSVQLVESWWVWHLCLVYAADEPNGDCLVEKGQASHTNKLSYC